jgi:hypothetical protein
MQADGTLLPGDSQAARAQQVQEAIAFINAWAPAGRPREDTIVMGDLNIPADAGGAPTPEYLKEVSPGGFATIGLRDSWRLHQAPEDPASRTPA